MDRINGITFTHTNLGSWSSHFPNYVKDFTNGGIEIAPPKIRKVKSLCPTCGADMEVWAFDGLGEHNHYFMGVKR